MNVALSKVQIAVAVSTYNGERYLFSQIESILSQQINETIDITIFVRDDGSSDGTCHTLEQYEKDGKLVLIRGCNVGVSASFISLLQDIPDYFDYIALCDQDDVWHKDKLERAISILSACDQSIPQLYCSEYIFCDAELNPIEKSTLNKHGICFEKLLFENVCSGNTMVMNRTLHMLVSSLGYDGVYCHDWWLAQLAAALGDIHYDKDFYSLDYRRIGENASPTGSGALRLLRYRFSKFIQGDELASIKFQLRKLLDSTSDNLDTAKASALRLFLSSHRFRKVLYKARLRQTVSGELMVRLLFLFGRL